MSRSRLIFTVLMLIARLSTANEAAPCNASSTAYRVNLNGETQLEINTTGACKCRLFDGQFSGDGSGVDITANPTTLDLVHTINDLRDLVRRMNATIVQQEATIQEHTRSIADLAAEVAASCSRCPTTGSTGSSGTSGSSGSFGTSGTSGSTRSSGSTGSFGSTGSSGSIGSTGSTGSIGSTGSTGSTGTTGFFSMPSSNQVLWLTGDVLVNANGRVQAWTDRSPVNRAVAPWVSNVGPAQVLNVVNGRPVVRFPGVYQAFLMMTPPLNLTEWTIFVVGRNTGSSYGLIFGQIVTGSMQLRWESATQIMAHHGSSRLFSTSSVCVPSFAAFHTFTLVYSARRMTAYLNGCPSPTVFDEQLGSPWLLGPLGAYDQNLVLNGDLAEVIVYNSGMTNCSRSAVELHLCAKYGFTCRSSC